MLNAACLASLSVVTSGAAPALASTQDRFSTPKSADFPSESGSEKKNLSKET